MRLFKYYRPDFYFEKSLRYDEIFFASNEQLNDPHDLVIRPYFGNNTNAWKNILKSDAPHDTWDLSKIIDVNNENLLQELSDELNGQTAKTSSDVISVLDSKKDSLEKIFGKYLISPRHQIFEHPESASAACVPILKEKIVRGWDKRYYSCSFSKDPLEPTMWAHYGGGFKGCVLIYKCLKDGSINLRKNIYIKEHQNFKFSEVNYQDKDKSVDILHLSSTDDLIKDNLLNKNLFWSYEKEMRLLLGESFGSMKVSVISRIPKSTKTPIYHHDNRAIEGVIFGSNCSESYKNKVTSMLAEKYSFLLPIGSSAFLTFQSKLTSTGKVEIISGEICTIHEADSSQVMKTTLQGERLNKILNELGIKN